MSRWLKNLNPEQREAVQTITGPLLVLAGAGSGKTRVITHRVAHMMELSIDPQQILGVTFTNKAAAEMRQRLTGMVGQGASKVTLSTFHSLGLHILRAERARRKRSGALSVFDTGDQLSCLRELCHRIHLERSLDLGSILQRISAYKNAFVEPGDSVASEDPYDEAATLLYPAYQEQLQAYSAVDFDDLVCLPTRMMEQSDACRHRWSDRFRHVLVDEYQDTNAAQLRMLRAIAGPHRNLCVVGDDDQSIYGWRGAEVRNILRFAKDFPGAKTVTLGRNYRSVGSVLRLAGAVIARNPERHEKTLVAVREEGTPVRMVVTSDGDSEARWIVSHIREALAGGRRGGDIAVLYRSNLFSRELESELRAEGIPYRVLGGTSFFESKEVKDLVAYLRICANPADEISLRRVINAPPRGIGPRTVSTLSDWSEKHQTSFYQALRQADEILGGGRSATAVAGFLELTDRYRRRLGQGSQLAPAARAHGRAPLRAPERLPDVARELSDELGLEAQIRQTPGTPQAADRRVARVRGLIDGMQSYCAHAPRPSLQEYLGRIALSSNEDDEPVGRDLVTLSSLHGAKGLEFRLVLLAGMEEGYLPHERTINPHQNDMEGGDIAEERRLLYVGITRAMDELVLTRCQERMLRGRPQPRTPTRFLDDIGPELLQLDDLTLPPDHEQMQSMLADLIARLEG